MFYYLDSNLNIESSLSYCELNDYASKVSLKIPNTEKPVLLLFDNVLNFIKSFAIIEKANKISIPMFFPKSKRNFDRLEKIILDSESELIICENGSKQKILKEISFLNIDVKVMTLDEIENLTDINTHSKNNEILLIQYTSGSTSHPKGVKISHENIKCNLNMIKETFNCTTESKILSWLPFYHDMGLIGNILLARFLNIDCYLISSSTIVQSPIKWLQSISKFKITHSGGPNFIYDLCLNSLKNNNKFDLDLSSWKVAYNGSEPIKRTTIDTFIDKIKLFGFNPNSYYTCYGLAEATLLVSAGRYLKIDKKEVSSGSVCNGINLKFYDFEKKEINQNKGEIILYGNSITKGYYNLNDSKLFLNDGKKIYLRTGDLGESIGDELYVTGRIKEMIIINGKNYFPYDLEQMISDQSEVIQINGVGITELSDGLLVVAECKRQYIRENEVFYNELRIKIDRLLIDEIGVSSRKMIFVTQGSLPRTSSGKIQRKRLAEMLNNGELSLIQNYNEDKQEMNDFELSEFVWELSSVKAYLESRICKRLSISDPKILSSHTLLELGLSSIKAVELINQIRKELCLEIAFEELFNLNHLETIAEYIIQLYWLKTSPDEGNEIEL